MSLKTGHSQQGRERRPQVTVARAVLFFATVQFLRRCPSPGVAHWHRRLRRLLCAATLRALLRHCAVAAIMPQGRSALFLPSCLTCRVLPATVRPLHRPWPRDPRMPDSRGLGWFQRVRNTAKSNPNTAFAVRMVPGKQRLALEFAPEERYSLCCSRSLFGFLRVLCVSA